MKLLSKEIKNYNPLYNGFIQGTDTDKDVLARACGLFDNDVVCSVELKLEDEKNLYTLKVDYYTTGEQKLVELEDTLEKANKIGYSKDKIENAYNSARKNKANTAEQVIILTKIFDEYPEVFSNNCWYEGVITLIRKNKTTEECDNLICNEYESALGLEGVHDSIQGIHDYYNKDDENIELVEWLLELDCY